VKNSGETGANGGRSLLFHGRHDRGLAILLSAWSVRHRSFHHPFCPLLEPARYVTVRSATPHARVARSIDGHKKDAPPALRRLETGQPSDHSVGGASPGIRHHAKAKARTKEHVTGAATRGFTPHESVLGDAAAPQGRLTQPAGIHLLGRPAGWSFRPARCNRISGWLIEAESRSGYTLGG